MPKGLYKDISKLYNNALECYATKDNHFLDNYCDPFKRSFLNLTYIEEDCLLINPPFTENIIRATLFKTTELLSNGVAYIFLPLWYDLIDYISFINLQTKYIIHFPKSIVYDFNKKQNIKSSNIKQQLLFLSK